MPAEHCTPGEQVRTTPFETYSGAQTLWTAERTNPGNKYAPPLLNSILVLKPYCLPSRTNPETKYAPPLFNPILVLKPYCLTNRTHLGNTYAPPFLSPFLVLNPIACRAVHTLGARRHHPFGALFSAQTLLPAERNILGNKYAPPLWSSILVLSEVS